MPQSLPNPTTIALDSNGNPHISQEASASISPVVLNEAVCAKPASLSLALTSLSLMMAQATALLLGWRRGGAVTFENVAVGSSGAITTFTHKLNRRVRWCVVGWRGANTTAGPWLVSDELDSPAETTANVLALRSYTAGTLDLEIW